MTCVFVADSGDCSVSLVVTHTNVTKYSGTPVILEIVKIITITYHKSMA